jgi:tRNA dimethylallyltransferase
MRFKTRLLIITGPTGIRKSDLAMKLISEFGGEIISADSMQVYRFMDIGTAKPTADDQIRVKHHLIDLVDPDETFSAAQYSDRARKIIDELSGGGRTPWVVGGSGLYIRALVGGLVKGPGTSENLRNRYRLLVEERGRACLYDMLRERDPAAAKRIHPNDAVRLMRALEVLELSGESIVSRQEKHRFADEPYEYLKIGLMEERERLLDKIDSRCNTMIERGLIGEVRDLMRMGFDEPLKSMQSLGYKHILRYIKGMSSFEEALFMMKRDTRSYAKRQMTWFRADSAINWFRPEEFDSMKRMIRAFLDS